MSFRKFDVRSRSWPDRKRSCCISVDPYDRSDHIYGVLIAALAGLYQKWLPKNCWWPFMTWNDLGDMGRGHWSQYSDSECQVHLQPDVWANNSDSGFTSMFDSLLLTEIMTRNVQHKVSKSMLRCWMPDLGYMTWPWPSLWPQKSNISR